MNNWELLHSSIAERWRPEDVAALASELMPSLATILKPATRYAWYPKNLPAFNRFGRPSFASHSINISILHRFLDLPSDPLAAITYLEKFTGLTSLDLRDRMPSTIRAQAGLKISRRRYMKLCRILCALRRKTARLETRGRFIRWTRIAQSAWALDITLHDFLALDDASRVFLAYYVARRQRQSTFSGTGQDSAWDTVSKDLSTYVTPNATIALVVATPKVLACLSDAERLSLLARAYAELASLALAMASLWKSLNVNQDTMTVARGMNSSDWNIVAGAYNALRALWLNLVYTCGFERDLDHFLPGKAMRLIAADVAAWHRHLGDSDGGPDVAIFKQLPLPWDVILSHATCTRPMVLTAANKVLTSHQLSKETWTKPATSVEPVATKRTDTLVHGVAVSDPALADILRRAGWFSGTSVPDVTPIPGVEVIRKDGFATKVTQS